MDENFNLSNDDIDVSPVPGRKSTKRKITSVVSPPQKRRIESKNSDSTEKYSDFICQICDTSFTRKDNLKRHNKRKH